MQQDATTDETLTLSVDVPRSASMQDAREAFERQFIRAIIPFHTSMQELANALGLSYGHLRTKLKRLNIELQVRTVQTALVETGSLDRTQGVSEVGTSK